MYGYLWNYVLTLFPKYIEHRTGWLFFCVPEEMQRKSMKSKFFPLNVHIGHHFENSAQRSGKF